MRKIELSIIIVSFNTEKLLKQCIDAIKSSDGFGREWELIVVDNASVDQTLRMIKNNHPEVELLSLGENKGFAAANNLGVKRACGEYILFLNPDTVVDKNTIITILNYMKTHPKVAIASSKVILPNGKIDDACHRGFPTPWNAICYFSGLAKIFPNIKIFSGYTLGHLPGNVTHEVDSVSGAFMMVKRRVGQQVKWWDEDYFWYGDDLDFCFGVKELGWKVMYIPEVKTLHYKGVSSGIKKHSNNLSIADKATKLKATNARFDVMKIFYQKHYEKKYPWIIKKAVLLAVELKRKIALRSLE